MGCWGSRISDEEVVCRQYEDALQLSKLNARKLIEKLDTYAINGKLNLK
jgi:hypothetical protein